MNFPKVQYVLARTRGSRTVYTYHEKLADVRARIKAHRGPAAYATLTRGPWNAALKRRNGDERSV